MLFNIDKVRYIALDGLLSALCEKLCIISMTIHLCRVACFFLCTFCRVCRTVSTEN